MYNSSMATNELNPGTVVNLDGVEFTVVSTKRYTSGAKKGQISKVVVTYTVTKAEGELVVGQTACRTLAAWSFRDAGYSVA